LARHLKLEMAKILGKKEKLSTGWKRTNRERKKVKKR